MKKYNWKTFFILLSLCLISVVCIFPYVLTLYGDTFKQAGISIPLLIGIQFIQGTILFSIVIFLGLKFTHKINFKLPLITAIVEKGNYKKVLNQILGKSTLLGLLIALAIYGVDALFTLFGASITTHQNYAPAWQTLLAAVYGGITEEVIMRLFLMALFIWISIKVFKHNQPSKAGIWASIFLAAIIFGLGHLPITAQLTNVTPLVIGRAVVLNGIGGIVFGWLFWKHGLESAMIAHFTTDVFLLTLLPLFF